LISLPAFLFAFYFKIKATEDIFGLKGLVGCRTIYFYVDFYESEHWNCLF